MWPITATTAAAASFEIVTTTIFIAFCYYLT
jgi:hypothetical protein